MIEGHSQTHDGIHETNDRKASLYALAIIIDDLKNDDPQCRLNGISKLPTVALAIGPERTRSELLMFLKEATNDEDEILLSIAGQMSSFLTYIGGIEYVSHLIPILETIMCVEENICREEAIKSMNILIQQMSVDQVVDLVVPLFEKYYQNEMFTIKSSLCCLFVETYRKLDKMDAKEKLCSMYKEMCTDDAPITRRAAASKMKEIIPILCYEHIENEVAPAFLTLLNDDQDSVRVAAADAFPEILASVHPNEKLTNILLTELTKLFRDKSWRIRYRIAGSIACFHGIVNEEYISNNLLPAYVSFLKDDEPEVRTSAAHRLYDFCLTLPPNQVSNILLTRIVPCIKILSDDINVNVKSAVATVLLRLSDFLDKAETTTILIPLFNTMLKDSVFYLHAWKNEPPDGGKNVADVRLNVLTNLENINKVVEAGELCNTLLPTIIELADDSKWRVRLAIIEYIPSLARQFGVQFFDSKLVSLCVSWLTDPVFSIRDAAGKVIGELVDCFGVEWADINIFPKLTELQSDVNYLRRMTCLFTINHLTKTKNSTALVPKFLSLVLKLATDRIPNVRFNSALSLQNLALLLSLDDNTMKNSILPKLEELAKDEDVDVRSFSKRAIEAIQSNFSTPNNNATALSH